jgi:phosphohistidine phosphatase
MKTLHLLRHAKSSWSEPGLADRERGLNKRGRRAAPLMGRALAQQMAPMSVAVSPARRAQLTLEGLCDGWPAMGEQSHCTEEDLYTFSGDDVLAWIAAQANSHRALFLIGHNPAFTEIVNLLSGSYVLDNLPTAGYARLALDIATWSELHSACGVLEQSLFPRQLSND